MQAQVIFNCYLTTNKLPGILSLYDIENYAQMSSLNNQAEGLLYPHLTLES